MSQIQTVDQIEYPESDGRPMGETDLHRDWMFRILEVLRERYRGQRVYLTSDVLLYYQEGVPSKVVVPDVFVVLHSDPGRRRTYKTWEEGKTPDVVFEVTSRGTRREDEVTKPGVYSQLGVKEYYLYDPTAEYLKPPLQGHRLDARGDFARIEPDAEGRLTCETLGILLRLDGLDLVLIDAETGEVLLTGQEAEAAARAAEAEARAAEAEARKAAESELEKERAARSAEQVAREAAEARAAELAAKLERLQAESKQSTDPPK